MYKTLVHRDFSYIDCDEEIRRLQAQIPNLAIKPDFELNGKMYSNIFANNKNLFNIHNEETLCIWFKVFPPSNEVFKDKLEDTILNRNVLLKTTYETLQEGVAAMFNEYIYWLHFVNKSQNAGSVSRKFDNKDVLKFIFTYNNKMYYLKNLTKMAKDENTRLNPFIYYWLDSYLLRQILKISLDTLFLPDVEIKEIQDLKKIKEYEIK